MSVVACLHPRQWDGRRLLQFLTGLALVALAFAAPALAGQPETPEQTPIVTTVDAPTGGPGLGGRIIPAPRAAAEGSSAAAEGSSAASEGSSAAGDGSSAAEDGESVVAEGVTATDLGEAPTRIVPVSSAVGALTQPAVPAGEGADQSPFAGRAPPRV